MKKFATALALTSLTLSVAAFASDGGTCDAGRPDGGVTNAGSGDAGTSDAGRDAGFSDAGVMTVNPKVKELRMRLGAHFPMANLAVTAAQGFNEKTARGACYTFGALRIQMNDISMLVADLGDKSPAGVTAMKLDLAAQKLADLCSNDSALPSAEEATAVATEVRTQLATLFKAYFPQHGK